MKLIKVTNLWYFIFAKNLISLLLWKDGNGDIDFEEFVAVMSRKVNATYTSDQVKSAFKVFEGSAPSGYVKADTLIRAICTYGVEKLTEDQAADLISQLDVDVHGYIHYSEYVNMMMSS